MSHSLARFARYVKAGHRGPLTIELMAAWARAAKGWPRSTGPPRAPPCACCDPSCAGCSSSNPPPRYPTRRSSARFRGAMTPHIFRDEEIVDAAGLPPGASVRRAVSRGSVMQTLFGLIACTGLRISEALGLARRGCRSEGRRADRPARQVRQIAAGTATREAVAALARYRSERARFVPTDPDCRSSSAPAGVGSASLWVIAKRIASSTSCAGNWVG